MAYRTYIIYPRQFTRTQNGVPELGATKTMNHQTINQEYRILLADNPSLFEDKLIHRKLIHKNMNGRVSIFLDYQVQSQKRRRRIYTVD